MKGTEPPEDRRGTQDARVLSGMRVSLPQLEHVRIASPCSARWEDMRGDEVRRFCEECSLHVTNLSAMTREDAEAFLAEATRIGKGGRVCVRLFQRADGTVLSADCPVGLSRVKAEARRALLRVVAGLGLATLLGAGAAGASRREGFALGNLYAVRWLTERLHPSPNNTPTMGKMVMGDMCIAPSPPPAPAAPTPAPATGGGAGQ